MFGPVATTPIQMQDMTPPGACSFNQVAQESNSSLSYGLILPSLDESGNPLTGLRGIIVAPVKFPNQIPTSGPDLLNLPGAQAFKLTDDRAGQPLSGFLTVFDGAGLYFVAAICTDDENEIPADAPQG